MGLAVALVVSLLGWTVWQQQGSRVALFVCFASVAAATLDAVWAQVSTGRVTATVTAGRADVVVGEPVPLTVALAGAHQWVDVSVAPFGPQSRGADVPGELTMAGRAASRGVVRSVEVELVGRGLAGFVWCARRRTVALPRPVHVGPRPVPAPEALPELARSWGEGPARPAPSGDQVRGVRPYQPGDPMARVHWRATARDLSGDLVVKEVEDTGAPRLLVVLDLGRGGAGAEAAAGRAAWYAGEGLARGYQVELSTYEPGRGPVAGEVTSAVEVLRRLAAAGTGGPARPAEPRRRGVVVVTDQGDEWH